MEHGAFNLRPRDRQVSREPRTAEINPEPFGQPSSRREVATGRLIACQLRTEGIVRVREPLLIARGTDGGFPTGGADNKERVF